LVFIINQLPQAPDTWVEAFFEYSFEFAKKIDNEIAEAVSMTPLRPKMILS
jgi:hypothetical protein